MITIYELEGRKLVCSVEIYRAVGYNKDKYIRWLETNIYPYTEKGVDYFDKQEAPSGQPGHPVTIKHLLTIELAVAICLMSKTEKSKKVKKWLQQNR